MCKWEREIEKVCVGSKKGKWVYDKSEREGVEDGFGKGISFVVVVFWNVLFKNFGGIEGILGDIWDIIE